MRIMIVLLIVSAMLAGCAPGEGAEARTEKPPIEARACEDETKTGAVMMTIQSVLERLPQGFLDAADVETIFICEELTCFGIPAPAAAIRTDGKTTIYVEYGTYRKVDVSFTHELFHAFELKNPVDEEAWAAINPYDNYPFDTYGPGDVYHYTPNMTPAFEPGFASDYARFSAMEDRAELFTALFSGRTIHSRERTAMLCDPFLMEKTSFLIDYMGFSGGLRDNLFIDTEFSCRVYALLDPESARIGPSEAYPSASLKAGQLLAYSGFEKDGIKMLYDPDFRKVYVPSPALEPLEKSTLFVYPR